MKALWLTSWYPNKLNPTNGDFVQRHAKAVSLFCKVDVIHVEQDDKNILTRPVETIINNDESLTETTILFKPKVNKIFSLLAYRKYFKNNIIKYIKKNGLPDIVHVQVAMKAGMLALWIKKKYKIPYVITDQWTIYNSQVADRYENRSWLFKYFTTKIFNNASLFISVSKNLTEIISKKITSVPYKIVYNVVDINLFFYAEIFKQQPFTFIHVSTLKEQKNPEAIIDAFVSFNLQFPQSQLVIVGNVNNEITNYVHRKNLASNNIRFVGSLPYEAVAKQMQQASTFILFSRRENMPCVVLEALCCGLPVITSNAGGVAEVITDENGIVVYNYQVKALTDAMIFIYKNYHQYNQKAIAEKAKAMFCYTEIGAQIKHAYEQIIHKQ